VKYHINPETGNPGVCKAKHKCKFGDMESDHYSSKEEARDAYEKVQEKESKSVQNNEAKLVQLKKQNAKLTKDSLDLKKIVDNLNESIAISTSTGDSQTFEEDYEALQNVETNRNETLDKLKKVQKEIAVAENELKKQSKKATLAQLRDAREENLISKASLSQAKRKLKTAEENLQKGIESRTPIAELRPIFNEVKTLKEATEEATQRNKTAMNELNRLEKLEPKRKPNKPDTYNYSEVIRSSYGCGSGGSGGC
jgi:septal ring factor EnvC (AmiA/AmiB activator)